MSNTPSTSLRRRGTALIYAMTGMVVMGGFAALAVDWGRVQLTKTELQSAADAAARYGVAGLQNQIGGISAAYANAQQVTAQNKANGRAISFQPSDVEIGKWNTKKRTFKATTDLSTANAVRVTLQCSSARGTAVPLTFMSMLGKSSADIHAVSVAMITYSNSGGTGEGKYSYFIPATCNPWLAGASSGTIASVNNPNFDPDYAGTGYTDSGKTTTAPNCVGYTDGGTAGSESAPNQYNRNYANWGSYASKKGSPVQAGGISISAGVPITMDGVNGGANNFSSTTTYDGDGNPGQVVSNSAGAENGIANVKAPINSVIGVFLDDNRPYSGMTLPATMDFTTAGSRDFLSLKPALRQPFFIGDGRTSNGEVQQFVPPAGATRLYICTMDSYEWSNNVGGFFVTAHVNGHIVTVK